MVRKRCMKVDTTAVAATLAVAMLIAAISMGGAPVSAQQYSIQAALMTVFEDGAVVGDYYIEVDAINPTLSFSPPGTTYLDVMATGSTGAPLGFASYPGLITVNTLGEASVRVGYTTHDLTSKSGSYWTLNFTSPSAVRVTFPEGATVISINKVPDTIESIGEGASLLMSEGDIEISYVLSVVGTADYAIIAIADAQGVISSINSSGIKTSSADTLLSQARAAFDAGSYASAEDLAEQARSSALQANATAHQSSAMQAEASAAISKAESEGRAGGLDTARNLLTQSQQAYASGNYALALDLASQAIAAANSAVAQEQPIIIYAAAGALVIAAAAALIVVMSRRGGGGKANLAGKPYVKERREVDVEKIASEDELRDEDIDIIKALAESGGEALESEIRNRLNLPKTTLWRAAKRLEREGYITIESVAGLNRMRVRQEYCKSGSY